MPPRKTQLPPPPPDLHEDLDAEDEAYQDRDIPSTDPTDPDWFRQQLGATLFGNPRDGNDRTKTLSNLSTAPVVSAAGIEGADRWLVEIRNHETGQADYLGEMPLSATPPQVLRRFLDAMPTKEGQPSAEIYFKALDKTGTKIGTASKPDGVFTVPWHNPILRELLKERAAQTPPPTETGLLAAYLQKQLEQEREDRRAAQQRADEAARVAREMEQALLKQRLDHAANMQNDIGAAYQQVSKTQADGLTGLMSVQERMTLEREKREEERLRREREEEDRRRQRERDQYEEDRRRREEERRDERERLRAEAQSAVEKVKAEAEARKAEITAQLELERARIAAEVEKSRLAAEAERLRIQEERRLDDQRRRDEQERRDKLDAIERERAREFTVSMEKIRTEALAAERERMASEARRQEQHTTAMLGLIEKQHGGGHKLGVIGELLDTLGMPLSDLLEKGKELIGGGATTSTAVAVIEGLGSVAREFIKRLPMPEEDEGDGDEEEETEGEVEEAPAPRRRRVRQIEQQEYLPEPAPKGTALPAVIDRHFEAAESPDKVLPLAERKAGRKAVESLVDRLEKAEDWRVAVMDGQDVDALVRYIGLVGLNKALEGYDVDAERLGAVLVELGLFESAPLGPSAPEKVEKKEEAPALVKMSEAVPTYTVPQKNAPLYGKEGEK